VTISVSSQRAIIFAGPSLPPALRPSDPVFDWRPPVRQGDVDRAVQEKPAVIGIIDGYFEVTPTVWHKEILRAMADGIHVYGAASVGALRAAELHTFGMVGIGRVFEMFRDGILEDDDEVAVLHGPEELGYQSLTEAMVNIRATLDAAVAAGVLDRAFAAHLAGIAKVLFYKERSWDAMLHESAESRSSIGDLNGFSNWLRKSRVDQKRADAIAMIATIRWRHAAGVTRSTHGHTFRTTGFHRAASQSGQSEK
jgi:hypothetical protein